MRFTSSRASLLSAVGTVAGCAAGAAAGRGAVVVGDVVSCAHSIDAASRTPASLIPTPTITRLLVFIVDLLSGPGFQGCERHPHRALSQFKNCGLLLVLVVFEAYGEKMPPLLGKQCHPCDRNCDSHATSGLLPVLQI